MAASMLLHMHGDIDQRILTPYFYTRISCCEPGAAQLPEVMDFSGRELNLSITAATCHCDLVATYGADVVSDDGTIPACGVPQISRDSPLWSHSAHCSNWPYVREQTQVLITAWGSVAALVSVVVLPAAGNLADLYGRLQIFIWSSAIVGIGFLIFVSAQHAWLVSLPSVARKPTRPVCTSDTRRGVSAPRCSDRDDWCDLWLLTRARPSSMGDAHGRCATTLARQVVSSDVYYRSHRAAVGRSDKLSVSGNAPDRLHRALGGACSRYAEWLVHHSASHRYGTAAATSNDCVSCCNL